MKTAIDETILKMQEAKDNFPSFGFDEEFVRGFNKAFQMAIFISEQVGKEKEKKQIIEAYRHGKNVGYENSETYYNETYSDK